MSHDDLQIRITSANAGRLTVEMIGEAHFDFDDADDYVHAVLVKKPQEVTVDLSRLTFLSSIGMSFLISLRKALRALDVKFEVTGMQPRIRQVLDHARVLHMFEPKPSE